MVANLGGFERKIRLVGGILLIGIGALTGLPTTDMVVLLGLGAILFITGAVRYCPLSALFGVNNSSTKSTARK